MAREKPKRLKLVDILPSKYDWISRCTKHQIPSILLKLLLDEAPNDKKVLYWPRQCGCGVACEFCVLGNNAAAVTVLQALADEQQYDVNFFAWWKRYVRHTKPRLFQAGAKTYYCFVFTEKPEFFVCDGATAAAANEAPRVDNDVTVANETAEITAGADETTGTEQQEDLPTDGCPEPPKKARREYRCHICQLPKKGHSCRGIAPPPLPVDEPLVLLQAPPIPRPVAATATAATTPTATARPAGDDIEVEFESVFVPEVENGGKTRLERVFKSGANNTSTTIGWRNVEPLNTDIDL